MKDKIHPSDVIFVKTDQSGDYLVRSGKLVRNTGIHWILASFLICADIAGSGIVALPIAITRLDFYAGMGFLTVVAISAVASAIMLGESWGVRSKMRLLVTIVVNFTQFGATTVFLLLSATNLSGLLHAFFHIDINFCFVVLIVAGFLFPITLLKSPQHFWQIIVGGMISTIIAMGFIVLGASLDYKDCAPTQKLPPFKIYNVFLSFGTILFTYGGHSAFPTIQHDMKQPADFRKSALFAITTVSILNMIVSSFAVMTYGDSLRDSVIGSIQTFWIQQAISVMITAHCLMTVVLIINPLAQTTEEFFKIPQGFTIKRVAVRAAVMVLCVFVAETIPNFGSVLDLIGGSTVTLTSFTFPCLFYLFLSAGEKKAQEIEHIGNNDPLSFREMVQRTKPLMLLFGGVLIFFSALLGLIATITAMQSIVGLILKHPAISNHF
uniref:Amino acid transporter transmembrane domain-containing protein n=1 Tax=Ditylenchus dipsaci TaxID=166011 RepID=A0A915CPS8_9BILA